MQNHQHCFTLSRVAGIQHEFLADPFRWSYVCGEANGVTPLRPLASWVGKSGKYHLLARLSLPKTPNKKKAFRTLWTQYRSQTSTPRIGLL